MQKVYFDDIYIKYQKNPTFIYASLYDAEDNSLVISASLDYCVKAIKERNYILVKKPKNV